MKNYLLALSMALLSCSVANAQSLEKEYFVHQNQIRDYLIYVPAAYDVNQPAALIFVFHGFGSSPENMQGVGLNAFAESNNYIMVYPRGALSELGTVAWNCGSLLSQSIDDVGFINGLLDQLIDTYAINERRIYATGFSLGGMMCHRLACEKSDRFAAIASVGAPIATSVGNSCNTLRKMPVLYIHGTADVVLPYTGSAIIGSSSGIFTMNTWARVNDCVNNDIDVEQVPDTATTEFHVEKRTLANCEVEGEIVHYKINRWPHSWPLEGNNINATEEIVKFFEKHTMPIVNTPTGIEVSNLPEWITVGPNPFNQSIQVQVNNNYAISSWVLYAANGQKVLEGENVAKISAEKLAKGLYTLLLRFEDEIYSTTLLKQ